MRQHTDRRRRNHPTWFVICEDPVPSENAESTIGGLRTSSASAESTDKISIEGYDVADLTRIHGFQFYVQVYTGIAEGNTEPSDMKTGKEWTDGTPFLTAWTDAEAEIMSVHSLWRNRPPLFDDMVTYLRPVPGLPCEGDHFLVKELYERFRELNAIIKSAHKISGEVTAYSDDEVLDEWEGVRASMNRLRAEIKAVCACAGLKWVPNDAVLRVVGEWQHPDGTWRVCARSQSSGSIINYDRSENGDGI